MSKGITFSVLIVLVILVGATSYFASKSVMLEQAMQRRSTSAAPTAQVSTTSSPTSSTTVSATPSASTSTSATPAANNSSAPTVAAKDRVSQFAQTHTVAEKETLSSIGTQVSVTWTKIQEANGLSSPDKIKIGQILAIPHVDAAQKIFEVLFTSDPAKLQSAQSSVNSGQNTWRTNPISVAIAENSGVFSLSNSDDYQQASKDDSAGTATINVNHIVDNVVKKYEIRLTQPGTKGANGVWTIDRVISK